MTPYLKYNIMATKAHFIHNFILDQIKKDKNYLIDPDLIPPK